MDTLTSLLEEAAEIVNIDLEPFAVDNDTLAEQKRTVHKASKSASTNLKKSWKKPADKPKRPLSAYNIFFQHEREKIITNNADVTLEEVLFKIKNTVKPKKRRHRKSHGMIGFAQLARTIADTWKALDDSGKSSYEAKAAIEKAKYREDLEVWAKVREEKSKEDEHKTPMELARVEPVSDDEDFLHNSFHQVHHIQDRQAMSKFTQQRPQQDSLSTLLMGGGHLRSNPLLQMATQQSNDVRDYLNMTQQTLDMARASLSLPLFANIQVTQQHGFSSDAGHSNHIQEFTPYFGMPQFEGSSHEISHEYNNQFMIGHADRMY